MVKNVSVLVGAGSIGQAIIRRVSAGKHIVLADYRLENAEQALPQGDTLKLAYLALL